MNPFVYTNGGVATVIDELVKSRDAFQRSLERHRVTLNCLKMVVKEIEQHCPCGARPESLNTHPHVSGCPVERALLLIENCQKADRT